jgi:uncharacterized membrane protein
VTSVVAAGVTALPAAGWAAAEPGTPCVRENLPLPAGSWQAIDLVDADPSGRFQIAWGTDTSWRPHLIRWDHDVPADLGTPPGSLYEVNEQGDIVGGATTKDGLYHSSAWRYSGGQMITLPGLPDSVDVVATSITADGTVAGWVRSADRQRTAVTWSPDNAVQALPGSGDSQAIDIDTDGTAVGYLNDAPVRWAPGEPAEVLPAFQPGPDTHVWLTAISAGTVIGQESTTEEDSSIHAVVWAPGAEPVSLGKVEAHAISARGSIAYERVYENEQWFRQDGVDRALPFGPSPYSIADVMAVTDDDTVYGMNYSNPVRWICA